MKYYLRHVLLLLLIFEPSSILKLRANENFSNSPDSIPVQRQLTRGTSFYSPTFRDFATSPLFYDGFGLGINWGWVNMKPHRDRRIGLEINVASALARIPESDYFQSVALSNIFQLQFYYQYLYHLKRLTEDNPWQYSLGGTAIITQNIRANPFLMNAGAGLEAFANIGLTGKVRREWSRNQAKTVDFFLFKKTYLPRKRYLDFHMNVGIINFNHRPGYAFVYDGEIDGTLTNPVDFVLSDYVWKLNGWRLGSQIEWSSYRKSGNGHSWSYIWEAIQAPGRHEIFQYASHRIQYTLIINKNKD